MPRLATTSAVVLTAALLIAAPAAAAEDGGNTPPPPPTGVPAELATAWEKASTPALGGLSTAAVKIAEARARHSR
jgi:hypothetical protein